MNKQYSFYNPLEMKKSSEAIRPRRNIISHEMLEQVYENFRNANLEIVEERRKANLQTRTIRNMLCLPVHGRLLQMELTFSVSDDGLKLKPAKEEMIGFIKKRIDSIFN